MAFVPFIPGRRVFRIVKLWLPELNFITLHYLYFIGTCLLSGIVFWGSSTPAFEISFLDSIFLCISAMTESGLNTVNLSELNTWQQVIMFLLTIMGSTIFVSSFIVHIRRRAFEKRFLTELERDLRLGRRIFRTFSRAKTRSAVDLRPTPVPDRKPSLSALNESTTESPHDEITILDGENNAMERSLSTTMSSSIPLDEQITTRRRTLTDTAIQSDSEPRIYHITFGDDTKFNSRKPSDEPRRSSRVFQMSGVGARSAHAGTYSMQSQPITPVLSPLPRAQAEHDCIFDEDEKEKFGHEATGRNSVFHNLTYKERERLGGVEFKAVVFLSWLVPIYFVAFQLLGSISIGAFVASHYSSLARENGLDPWWVGVFNAVSAFNNNGMSLLDANMTVFSRTIFMLLSMSLLILAGNTCFPIFLRLSIWTIFKMLPKSERWTDLKSTLEFLLEHPRRCFTNLFPSQHTWWLLWSVIALNGIDCIMFVLLNIGNKKITELEPGYEFINGLFQAFAVRAGGFYVVPISNTRISLQVLYVIMMYISAFPIAITIRNSNVYEERSLGIYRDDPEYDHTTAEKPNKAGPFSWFKNQFNAPANESSRRYFIQQQLRAQLAHDLWWLGLAVFLIMITESSSFERNPVVYSVFNIIFEIVSAYGTVGISVGLPDKAYSFCGDWHALSKLILCAVMLRGRHRGLPVAIDKAVLLPRENMHTLEEEDARIRKEKAVVAGLPAPC